VCAAGALCALALVAQPLAAQSKQSNGSGTGGAAQGTAAGTQPQAASSTTVDESKLLIPGGTASAPAGAATQPSAAPATPGAGGVSTWDFVRMLLILVGVVAFIYLLFWLLRRGAGKKIQENEIIHVLGSRSLAGNRALHLVEVGKSVYLVGSSDGGVQLISEITEKESLDSVRLKAAEQSPAGRRSFQQLLSEIFKPAKRPLSVGDGIGLLKGQRDRLRKL
jgi:flagellar biogenesis protein FliO